MFGCVVAILVGASRLVTPVQLPGVAGGATCGAALYAVFHKFPAADVANVGAAFCKNRGEQEITDGAAIAGAGLLALIAATVLIPGEPERRH
jgi:hypothetical protein